MGGPQGLPLFGVNMSKKVKSEELKEESIEAVEEVSEEPKVSEKPAKVSKKVEQPEEISLGTVEINLKRDLKFAVGPKWYELKAGKQRVSQQIYQILSGSGLLLPI